MKIYNQWFLGIIQSFQKYLCNFIDLYIRMFLQMLSKPDNI